MSKRYELKANVKDILNEKIKIIEVRELPDPTYKIVSKNLKRVNKTVKPGIKIVEEGEIDHVKVEYA